MSHHRRTDSDHLERLRSWRVWKGREQGLGDFLPDQFKSQVAKPHQQVKKLSEAWIELVPPNLRQHTRLESFSRGTLKVTVDSASHRYELDRMLRSGLERQLISLVGGKLRRVRLGQASLDQPWSRDERNENESNPGGLIDPDEI